MVPDKILPWNFYIKRSQQPPSNHQIGFAIRIKKFCFLYLKLYYCNLIRKKWCQMKTNNLGNCFLRVLQGGICMLLLCWIVLGISLTICRLDIIDLQLFSASSSRYIFFWRKGRISLSTDILRYSSPGVWIVLV